MQTLIIAEAGVNHNGDINLARKLIEVAAQAGADYVKFQTFSSARLATSYAKKASYQFDTETRDENQVQMLQKLELAPESYIELKQIAREFKIGFLSTAFDIESLDFLLEIGLDLIKIPSGEITNFPMLRQIGKLGMKTLLSTGASTLDDIECAISILRDQGLSLEDLTVLQCTSAYPAPPEEVNLRAMREIASTFNVKVGYSDHTAGIAISIGAVALGAAVIEKHFTLDKSMKGPDHKASVDPEELSMLVKSIRLVEKSLGDGHKTVTRSEHENQLLIRKSIVANCVIKKGEKFSESNLTTKRPAGGIPATEWQNLIGTYATRDYIKDELIVANL